MFLLHYLTYDVLAAIYIVMRVYAAIGCNKFSSSFLYFLQFRAVTPKFLRDADGIVLVYDVTNKVIYISTIAVWSRDIC